MRFERLLPSPGPVELADAYADPGRVRGDHRPWLTLTMVASADGGATMDGRAGGLGREGDREVLAIMRSVVDAIFVGASTVRSEGYGPPRKPGQRVAVVTRSGRVDWSSPLFTSGAGLAVLPEDGPEVPVEAIRAGQGGVDLAAALVELRRRGAAVVGCEGGPTLNGELFAADLVDELSLSVAPLIVGGEAPRIVVGSAAAAEPWRLGHVLTDDDGYLYLRYLRR